VYKILGAWGSKKKTAPGRTTKDSQRQTKTEAGGGMGKGKTVDVNVVGLGKK